MAGRSFCWAVGLALILHAAAVPARGQWVEPPGRGWLHVNVYHHATSRQFDADARRASIFAEGRAQTTSLLVSGAIGLFRGVDAWAQLPLHRLRYRDAGGARERVGPGDPRFYLRLSPTLAGLPAWPVAFRAGVKLPGGDFPVDAEIIPLGEGQRDWEAMIEVGHSFYPRPLYAMAWAGRRWRAWNEEANKKPGDEWFAFLAVGGSARQVSWKVVLEGWSGASPIIQGIVIASARQSILQLLPTTGWRVGPGALEAGLRVPLAGRNLPAGPALSLGYFLRVPGR